MSLTGSPKDNDNTILTCQRCGMGAFSLRAIGDAMSRRFVCTTCYQLDALADVETVELPAVSTRAPAESAELPMEPVADMWSGCTPEPEPGAWCAAAYLVYLERTGMSFIPVGDPTLCPAHWRAVLDDALQQYPKLALEPWKVPQFARILADTYMTAALTIADRIAMRQGR